MAHSNLLPIVRSGNLDSVKVRLCCELMSGDILIMSFVWIKVYPPNKPTPGNRVKKFGPES